MTRPSLLLFITLIVTGILPHLVAQQPTADQLAGLQYRSIGPHRGGRVTAVTGVRGQLFTFYMGATGGGVWRTTDGGLNWENISDGGIAVGSIGAIEVAPSDPNVLYVGTGSACPRGNVSPGNGMYRSRDGGQSWRHIGLEKAGQIGRLAIHPQDPDLVYAAVLGNVFGPSPERGVYRSKDGGESWEKVLFVSARTGAVDLVMDAHNPRVLYAGMWTAERKPWTLIDGSTEGGVWKTTDGGDSWQKLEGGLPTGLVGRVGVAVSPANPSRVWVIQEAADETKGGLYRSDDGGQSFQRINRDHDLRQRAWYYNHIFADPQDENTVYICNVGFLKSIDGGRNFQRIRTPHGDNHGLWINPDRPEVMIEGNDGGACVTFNGGQSWTTQNNQPTAEFYRVSVDEQWPYRVYGAQQDNSTISVSSAGNGGLTPYEDWYAVGGGESGHVAVDPRNPDIIYAGNYIGQITRTDRGRGHARDVVAYPQMHDGAAPRDIRYRFQWNAPIRLSPHNPDILYHCSQYVHRSADGGQSWTVISPDLTTNKDEYHDIPGGPIQHDHTGVELYTTIFAFEESPHQAGELWAGSDDGRLHITRDGGQNWTEITPPQIPKEGTINSIDLSVHAPGRALVAVYKYRENDFRPYIFLTNDYGKTWKALADGRNGIPADHFVRVVREDPNRRGLLYAGTEYGMYFSMNEGQSWQSFQLNLPRTPITDLLVKNHDLVVATQGRSFWILDDLSPLYQWTAEVTAQPAHLFTPADAHRHQLRSSRGAGAPEAAPRGAVIYFYLKDKPAADAPVRLSILDGRGKVRRVFSTKPDRDKNEDRLSARAGLNRFVWDLRYEAPDVQENARFSLASLDGVQAPMGPHTVKLEAAGLDRRGLLRLRPDPRWTQDADDLKAQYDLTMKVKALLDTCHQVIGEIRSIRQQVKDVAARAKKAGLDAAIGSQADSLSRRLTALEDELIQTKSESGQDPINFPPRFDDQIAYLYSVLNEMDARPTEGSYERHDDLQKTFEAYRRQFRALVDEDVKGFNAMLREKGVEVIMVK